MHKTSIFGISLLALAASGWISTASAQAPTAPDAAPAADAPAPDAKPAKPMKMHHHMMKPMHEKTAYDKKTGKLKGTKAGDAMVEDLNDKSLAAAKAGTAFTPGK